MVNGGQAPLPAFSTDTEFSDRSSNQDNGFWMKMLTRTYQGLTEDRISAFLEAFNLFDQNGDGFISIDELHSVMLSLGQKLSVSELQEMISEADRDGDGTIDLEEFLAIMTPFRKTNESNLQESSIRDLHEAFAIFDKDQNGFISPADLQSVLRSLGEQLTEEEVKEMILEADIDGDGLISFDEFVKFCNLP